MSVSRLSNSVNCHFGKGTSLVLLLKKVELFEKIVEIYNKIGSKIIN